MRHDDDIGCGKDSDKGLMHGISFYPRSSDWSTCSRREFEANYEKLKRSNNWCLKPGK